MSFERVAIIGLGLIGGSIGLAVAEHLPNVTTTGYDADPAVRRRAAERGLAGTICETARRDRAGPVRLEVADVRAGSCHAVAVGRAGLRRRLGGGSGRGRMVAPPACQSMITHARSAMVSATVTAAWVMRSFSR